jgi:predicted O-methyltransferase YrrM
MIQQNSHYLGQTSQSAVKSYSLEDIEYIRVQATQKKIPVLQKEKAQQIWELVQTIKPTKILELGTAIGYSGLILTHTNAQLVSVDLDANAQQQAKIVFDSHQRQVTLIHADGIQAMNDLVASNQKFDIIFIDFAKKKYLLAYELAKKLVVKGGYIVSDNVCMPVLTDYLAHVMQDPQCVSTLIEYGDGLLLSEFNSE